VIQHRLDEAIMDQLYPVFPSSLFKTYDLLLFQFVNGLIVQARGIMQSAQ
jgi:hypothetical protein